MTMTKGRIDRAGEIHFSDANLHIWEEPGRHVRVAGEWENKFKKEVFLRIAQQLRRLGWSCTVDPIDPRDVKHYGGDVARWAVERRRSCRKGDLQARLEVSGRTIKLEFWQDVQNVSNPNGGQYDFDKEQRMTYLQRLEMNRTRNRIRDYLCNVFADYAFKPCDPKMGLLGVTAEEKAAHDRRDSCHYVSALDHAHIHPGNDRALDGGAIAHGSQVWALDFKGRIVTGTAYYSLNNNWQIVTGKYGLLYAHTGQIFTRRPDDLRAKRNEGERKRRLEQELHKAVKSMRFERAVTLRDILFPDAKAVELGD